MTNTHPRYTTFIACLWLALLTGGLLAAFATHSLAAQHPVSVVADDPVHVDPNPDSLVTVWCEDAAQGQPCLYVDGDALVLHDSWAEIGQVEPYRYQPCASEDDPYPCYWWAAQRGNGSGTSFISRSLPEGGTPISAELARDLDLPGGSRDWTGCREYVGDTSWYVCPDGYRVSS